METDHFSEFFFDEEKVKTAFIWFYFCYIVHLFTVAFGLLNASLLNEISDLFPNLTVNIWMLVFLYIHFNFVLLFI